MAPIVPASTGTQKDVGKFVNGLAGSYLDCKEKLGSVVKIIDRSNAEAAKIAAEKPR